MATGYIYNGFGNYDEQDGKKGTLIPYGGNPLFFEYQKVTPIPDMTLREVDHDKSTPPMGEEGALVYMNVVVPGRRIVAEICNRDMYPHKYSEMGIIPIEGKPTGTMITVSSGTTEDGTPMSTEVMEREPTRVEVATAEKAATTYKDAVVQAYLLSKRERMNGGHGKQFPDKQVRIYMNELNIEDIDDTTARTKNIGGLNPEFIKQLMTEAIRATSETNAQAVVDAVKQVRADRSSLRGGKSVIAQEGEPQEPAPKVEVSPEEAERRRLIGERLAKGRAEAKQAKEILTAP